MILYVCASTCYLSKQSCDLRVDDVNPCTSNPLKRDPQAIRPQALQSEPPGHVDVRQSTPYERSVTPMAVPSEWPWIVVSRAGTDQIALEELQLQIALC